MKDSPVLRLAVTGALPADRYAVTTALSRATGIPRVAVSAESLVPNAGRRLGDTVEPVLRAFESRLDSEARATGGFISDGSILQEWVAADIRRRNRSRREWLWNPGVIPFRIFESSFLTAHAGTVARYANNSYDAVLHLRPEPDDDAVQDDSALLFDRIVIDTLYTLRIPYLVAGGGVEKTLTYVADMFRLPLQRPIAEALSATDEPAPDEFPAEQPAPTTTAEELANT